jgi:hypothetical protein
MTSDNDFALTRSIGPYVLYLVIFSGISLLGLLDWFILHDPSVFIVSLLGWVLLSATQYSNTRYRIYWHEGRIEQIAADKSITTINVSEITRITEERSDLRTLFSLTRPSHRISIYAKGVHGMKFIDVSFKHFVVADIRRLMQEIHEERPNLALPTI